jgi:hypothetical protein
MAEYTPKLDGLIRAYGDFFEAQLKEMLNPETNAYASTLRLAFRTKTKGEPLRNKIHKETGWDICADPEKHIPSLIALAEQNNSSAAQKLKSAMPVYTKMMEALEKDLPKDGGIIKGVRHAKKLNLAY